MEMLNRPGPRADPMGAPPCPAQLDVPPLPSTAGPALSQVSTQSTGPWPGAASFSGDAVGEGVPGFVKCRQTQPQPFLTLSRSPCTGGDQVGQAGPACPKARLAVPDALVVLFLLLVALRVICSMASLALRAADKPETPWILLLTIPVGVCHICQPPVNWTAGKLLEVAQ